MRKNILGVFALALTTLSCSNDDTPSPDINEVPATYTFTRNGVSTVSFDGQTTRILMGEELIAGLLDPAKDIQALTAMFTHAEGDADFTDAALNASGKNIYSKTAASRDYFSTNTTLSNEIKADFKGWLEGQVNEVFPVWEQAAAAGTPGFIQEAGGGAVRYVNAKGLEYDQAFSKSLIGALMTDQILNNYLSSSVLDEGTNVDNNDAGITEEGKPYTAMEHKWDEAYGYLYGTSTDASNPGLGEDSFLNKYLGRVEGDDDFAGIADEIFDAFTLGRFAITEKDYELRDIQANIIREKISEIIAIRAVYYLEYGKAAMESGDMGAAFHDLSEGFGFIYSLQFTRMPGTNAPYFTNEEVNGYLETLMAGDGFWDVDAATLEAMASEIASRFDFTVAQAL
ncbi:DUF4856 domain-containing protein [Robertkochia flava]|uniref:DUF4856 domain-containing protein n=1 Tax=Robertkochia flava TaxID=3447986 RepID=UPI001CC91E52|nr:DUF4856 domain-containing protein [Robertkochia marina]